MYLVSILVPIYNVEKYIERCVRSLMEQTYDNIQYVFVDDCSPDKSVEILLKTISEYPKRENNVKIVSHEYNRGLSAARNTAVKNATGLFLLHVDSDDYIEKDAVDNLVNIQTLSEADIVTGLALKESKVYNNVVEIREYSSMHEATVDVIKISLRHTIWGRLIRKSLYTQNGLHATEGVNVGEDAQVIPQLFFYANKVAYCFKLVYHYNCENENSYVHKTTEINRLCQKREQDIKSYLIIRDFFKDKDVEYFKEAELGVSVFAQKLMGYYVQSNDKSNFIRIKSIYSQLRYSKVKISLWHYFHNHTIYNYRLCRLTYKLLCLFARISKIDIITIKE